MRTSRRLCLLGLLLLGGCGTQDEPASSSAGEVWRAWGMSLPAAPSSPPDALSPHAFLTSEGLSIVGTPGQVFTLQRDDDSSAMLPVLNSLRAAGLTGPVLLHADPGTKFKEVWAVFQGLGSEAQVAMAVAGPQGKVGAIELLLSEVAPSRHLRLRVESGGLQIGLGEPGGQPRRFTAALTSEDGTCPTFRWADRERQPYEDLMRSAGTVAHQNGLTEAILEAPGDMSWGRVAEVGAWLRYRILSGNSRLGLTLGAAEWGCSDLPRVSAAEDLVF